MRRNSIVSETKGDRVEGKMTFMRCGFKKLTGLSTINKDRYEIPKQRLIARMQVNISRS